MAKRKKTSDMNDEAPLRNLPSGRELRENIAAQRAAEMERMARLQAVRAAAQRPAPPPVAPPVAPPIAPPAGPPGAPTMRKGGGIESKGKTQGKAVKMNRGGGIESKGKTKGRFC